MSGMGNPALAILTANPPRRGGSSSARGGSGGSRGGAFELFEHCQTVWWETQVRVAKLICPGFA